MSDFAEFHDELRSVARALLSDSTPAKHHGSPTSSLDAKAMGEAGWLGLEVPAELGGADCTLAESMLVVEELGRVVATADDMSSAVQVVGALNLTQPSVRKDTLLTQVCAGDASAAVALWRHHDAPIGSLAPFALQDSGVADGEGETGTWLLRGAASFVLNASTSDHIVLAAHDAARVPCLVVLPRTTPRLRIDAVSTVDETRCAANITADGVLVSPSDILRFDDDPTRSLRKLVDRAALGISFDSLGVIEAMLSATVAYVSERHQFGRPIGSFQAVKHACANMLVSASVSRELCMAALENSGADAEPELRSLATSMAKSYVCDAAVEVAGAAVQLHGGIGYSWESGIHVFQKRALFNRSLVGSPALHRAQIAQRYLKKDWTNQQ